MPLEACEWSPIRRCFPTRSPSGGAEWALVGRHREPLSLEPLAARIWLLKAGHCTATFRSLFGVAPLRIRRLLTCPCQNWGKAKSPNAGTVRNRTMRAGVAVVQPRAAKTAEVAAQPAKPVVVGLDGGYVLSRHREDERRFEALLQRVLRTRGFSLNLARRFLYGCPYLLKGRGLCRSRAKRRQFIRSPSSTGF
jgi:hypothetical protein